jgi:hypothetical protein
MQTRSGKTHTLQGSHADPGVTGRALSHLFSTSAQRGNLHALAVSINMLEVYNDAVNDLLTQEGEPAGTARRHRGSWSLSALSDAIPSRRSSISSEKGSRRSSLARAESDPIRLDIRSDASGARVVGVCLPPVAVSHAHHLRLASSVWCCHCALKCYQGPKIIFHVVIWLNKRHKLLYPRHPHVLQELRRDEWAARVQPWRFLSRVLHADTTPQLRVTDAAPAATAWSAFLSPPKSR